MMIMTEVSKKDMVSLIQFYRSPQRSKGQNEVELNILYPSEVRLYV